MKKVLSVHEDDETDVSTRYHKDYQTQAYLRLIIYQC